MKRAVVYARVSSERQAEEGLSVESQIHSCQLKAAELGAAVVSVYRDDGISGTTDARPGFRSAITHCTLGGNIDFMICWSSSRFARDQHDAITYKRELAAAGTRLVYASSHIDLHTQEGWLTDSFQQIIDENYSRQVSADTRRSMMKAAGDGFFMGGRVPFGYKAVPAGDGKRRTLQPHPEEARLVRMIFAQSAREVGAYAIAVALNDQGLTLRGRPWTKNTVLNMLRSEVYMGRVIYNRFDRKHQHRRPPAEWIRVQSHEALISDEIFDQVQAGLRERTPSDGGASPHSEHAFSGLLRCGHCSGPLQIANGTGRGGKVYYYYACRGDLQGKRCDFKRVRADLFDAWMLEQLLANVLTVENVQGVIDQLDGAATNWVKDQAAKRAALVLELRTAETRRSKLYEVLETHGSSAPGIAEMAPRLRELNAQIDRLGVALMRLEDEPEPIVGLAGVSAAEAAEVMRVMVLECENAKTLRSFVASIIEKIVIEDKEIRVDYHPECLIRVEGAAVHSTQNWLPVRGLLRTAQLRLSRPSGLGGQGINQLAA